MAIKARLNRATMERRLFALAPTAETAMATAIETGAKELAAAIKQAAPVGKTGEYRDSIMAVPLAGYNGPKNQLVGIQVSKSKYAWVIIADWYWRFLEFGTRPHTIKAKRVSDLVFLSKGKKIVTPQVAHPGTSAHPHIFNTYTAMRKRIKSRISRAVSKALKGRSKP